MVYQRDALCLAYEDVAKNLNVDRSTVWRTVDLFHRTGSVAKKKVQLYEPA